MKHSDNVEFYTNGACDSFAMAMAKLYGLKIRVMWSAKDKMVLHAWLISRAGKQFDARGWVSEESIVDQYKKNHKKFYIQDMTLEELEDQIGEGEWSDDAERDIQNDIEHYKQFIE